MFFLQKIKNLFWHLPKSIFFNLYYGLPSRKLILIGVTGTDGKTTTCTLIHEILKNNGLQSGLISTIHAKIGDKIIETGLHTTSPDPKLIQQLFRRMVKAGLTHCVCEVTSHALDQNRFWGCQFEISAITNTSHEHLDYHKTMENYLRSKTKLFRISNHAILNKDDPSYNIISPTVTVPHKTYSINKKSDFQAKDITIKKTYMEFMVNGVKIKTDSNYHYQIYNILASLAVTKHLGINIHTAKSTIVKFPETKGRREEVPNEFGIKTIIDFAHTPYALESTLSALKNITPNNLIVIFGATGGRDKSKRPLMGKTVSHVANIALLTSDDTRNEKVEDINEQIISGIDKNLSELWDYKEVQSQNLYSKVTQAARKKFTFMNIPNRQDAFNIAAKLAHPGDTIVACGKGHETTILHGSTEYPWSESEAFRSALRFRNI
ncbi:MAG: UDP-N-acetylmuramoyl-L-alanyl-D-glutamate--2,6-diaminopimelate ligase [Candidatus Shapirobacteria bacterium]|jgi:UDP-N-acetylmuramoyl-L-alanyl-D-glutamate--2,6-diaminopimelate ligase